MAHLLLSKNVRDLTNDEREWIDDIWEKWMKNVDEEGRGDDKCVVLKNWKEIDNRQGRGKRLRSGIKRPQHIPNAAKHLTPGWIGFLHEHHVVPRDKGEMSHLCGNKWCFKGSHIVHESRQQNLDRRTCHGTISTFLRNSKSTSQLKGIVTVKMVRKNQVYKHKRKCPHKIRPCFKNVGCSRNKNPNPQKRKQKPMKSDRILRGSDSSDNKLNDL